MCILHRLRSKTSMGKVNDLWYGYSLIDVSHHDNVIVPILFEWLQMN